MWFTDLAVYPHPEYDGSRALGYAAQDLQAGAADAAESVASSSSDDDEPLVRQNWTGY